MKKKKKLLEEKKNEREKINAETQKRKMEEVNEKLEKISKINKENHLRELLGFFQKSHTKRELQRLAWKRAKRNLIPKLDSYLYKKYELKYMEDNTVSAEEKRKEEFLRRKNMYKSITCHELEEHQQTYNKTILEHRKLKEKELIAQKEAEVVWAEKQTQYKTDISKRVHSFDLSQENIKNEKIIEKEYMLKKMRDYSKIINEVHQINPSRRKIEELQKMIIKLKHPVRKHKIISNDYMVSKIFPPVKYISAIKSKKSNVDSSIDLPKKQNHYKNYLLELRNKRDSNDNKIYNWSIDLKNPKITPEEKYKKIIYKADCMAKSAIIKQEALKLKHSVKQNIDEGAKINDQIGRASCRERVYDLV